MRARRSRRSKRRAVRRKVSLRKRSVRKGRKLRNTGFPDVHVVKMKYCESFLLNPSAAATYSSYVFRCGDIYDPNYSGTGHQPVSHDIWAAVYKYYEVLSATCTFKFLNPVPNGTVNGCYIPWAVTTPEFGYSTTFDTILEQPGMKKGMINNGSRDMTTLRVRYRKGQFGRLETSTTRALIGTSPGANIYFVGGIQSMLTTVDDAAGDPGKVYVTAEINYTVRLDTRRTFAQS